MRVAVLTFWDSRRNYGQVLQAYALQRYLRECGHDPYLIKYRHWKHKKNRSRVRKTLSDIGDRFATNPFDSFRKQLRFSKSYWSNEDLVRQPPEADIYIVGSDQVWNPNFIVPVEPYFLRFGDADVPRIAYAASFGHQDLPDECKEAFAHHLKTLDAISVRETSGVQICNELGIRNARYVVDPVFLLRVEDWDALSRDAPNRKQGSTANCFIYTIKSRGIPLLESAEDYLESSAQFYRTKLTLHSNEKPKNQPGISEWLRKIQTADLVVTNSFHATAFCIIFHTNFIALLASGESEGMNQRLINLLESVGLSEKILQTDTDIESRIESPIDWDAVDAKIAMLREDSENYLNLESYRRRDATSNRVN